MSSATKFHIEVEPAVKALEQAETATMDSRSISREDSQKPAGWHLPGINCCPERVGGTKPTGDSSPWQDMCVDTPAFWRKTNLFPLYQRGVLE
jgi:hypothetical protein